MMTKLTGFFLPRFALSGSSEGVTMKAILLAGLVVCVVALSLRVDDVEDLRFVGVVQSTASPKEKEAACGRLKQVGTARSVPALATLLNDEQIYQSACDALET